MILRKTFRFEASHVLPKHPGKCSRLHGHSWVLHVSVEGKVNPETGFVMDYADIGRYGKMLVDSLDHRHLGTWGHILTDVHELEDPREHDNWRSPILPVSFYPSSENLLWEIAKQITLPEKPYTTSSEINVFWQGLEWSKLALEETCTSYAELSREEFENARLPNA